MNRSELTNICNKIIQIHIQDLQNELPEIIRECTNSSDSKENNLANIIANVSANSVAHSVQAVTDVLVNVGLIEFDEQ